jgi:hypothetical protein
LIDGDGLQRASGKRKADGDSCHARATQNEAAAGHRRHRAPLHAEAFAHYAAFASAHQPPMDFDAEMTAQALRLSLIISIG